MKTLLITLSVLLLSQHIYTIALKRKNKRLKQRLDIKSNRFNSPTWYQERFTMFYEYLLELRKLEPKGNVHIINEILDKYDSLMFEEKLNK